jgi:hypothetical protein
MIVAEHNAEIPGDQQENEQPAPINENVDAEDPANSKSISHSSPRKLMPTKWPADRFGSLG